MFPDQLGPIAVATLTHDILRYAIGAGGVYAVVNLALSRVLAARKIRPATPGWPQMRREIVTSLRTVLIFAATGILVALGAQAGLFDIYEDVAFHGWAWFWTGTALIILAHDAWFYWTHRLIHHPRLFRRVHRTHHLSHNPTPFTSYAFDTAEAVLNAVFLPLFLVAVPMHPGALLIFVSHMMLRNALGHCGYELFPADRAGRPLFGWLTTVTHHDLHHANARWNMGLYFTWWDRWMGTEHPDYARDFARCAPRLPVNRRDLTRILALVTVLAVGGTAVRSDELRGTYTAPYLGAVVRFEPCVQGPGTTCGRLLWGWDAARWRGIEAGDMMISGLTPSPGAWTNGVLVHPETGLRFRGSVTPRDDGALVLKGCAGPICRRQIWIPLDRLKRRLDRLE